MIVIGVVCLALASADSRGHNLATFNNAKIAWAAKGGGAQQFSNAFVTSGAPSLSFTVPGGTSFTVPLTSSTQPSALADKGGDAKGCVPAVHCGLAGAEPAAQELRARHVLHGYRSGWRVAQLNLCRQQLAVLRHAVQHHRPRR
jgi:hypothetical protein